MVTIMTEKIRSDEVSLDEVCSMLDAIFSKEAQVEAKRNIKKVDKVVKHERVLLFAESFKKNVGYDNPFKVFTKDILTGLGEETTKVIKELVQREGEVSEDGLPITERVNKTVERADLPAYVRNALIDAGFDAIKVQGKPAYELYLYNPDNIIDVEIPDEEEEESLKENLKEEEKEEVCTKI